MKIKDQLTIVIPNKNEGENIINCLKKLNNQAFIEGTKVIIADSSDKGMEPIIDNYLFYNLDISFTLGGFPSFARRNGSLFVKTPYVLFIDADMFITDVFLLLDLLRYNKGNFDLLTIPFRTHSNYDWGYRVFDRLQWVSHKIFGQPFAIGGFQLFSTYAYWETGGYDPRFLVAEDYCISLKINPKRFVVYKHKNGIWTSPRRFKNKGILYMAWLMWKTFINRNNPEFFTSSHGYWD